jgi:hypothetical protein
MPEMDLRWSDAAGIPHFLWLQIVGYLGWPDDGAERSARIARYFAEQLARLETRHSKSSIEQEVNQFGLTPEAAERHRALHAEVDRKFGEPARRSCQDAFADVGGLHTLLSGSTGTKPFPSKEVLTAGHMLLTIRSIEEHHPDLRRYNGVRKAAFLIDNYEPNFLLVKNERYARDAWSKYKNISHLSASLFIIHAAGIDHLQHQGKGLLYFLAVAKDFANFAASFRSHSRAETLLDGEALWSIPKALGRLKLSTSPVPPLHQDDVATLGKYRSS